MNNLNETVEKLRLLLENRCGVCYLKGSKDGHELISLCPKCENHRFKNPFVRHGHLYINVETMIFNCFKCSYSGIVEKLIKGYGDNPKKYKIEIENRFSSIDKKISSNPGLFSDIERNVRFTNHNNFDTTKKMEYLRKRLGDSIDLPKINGLVLNIKEFIESNNITLSPDKVKMMDHLNDNYIGFYSDRGTRIICRNINENCESDKRYFILFLDKHTYYKDFYSVKTGVAKDISNTIVLAEGVFDVLYAFNSEVFNTMKNSSYIWAAAFNSGYNNLIPSILDYCKLPKAHVIILSDKDVPKEKYYKISSHPMVKSLNVFYNKNGKDFGEGELHPCKLNIRSNTNRNLYV